MRRGRKLSLDGSVAADQRLHFVTAMLADTCLLQNPLGAVGAFTFLTGFGGKPGAVTVTGLDCVGVGLLASRADFHGYVCSLQRGIISIIKLITEL